MLPWICIIRSLKTSHLLLKFSIFPPLSVASFSTSTPKILISDYLVNENHFSSESASNISSLSATNYLRKPQNADSALNFLKDNGFAQNHLETLFQKAPWILSANVERSVKPKIKIFQDWGFQSTDLADIVSASPFLLRTSADKLRLSVLRIKHVMGPNADLCMFLKNSGRGRFLASRIFEKKLIVNVEYLKSCGICSLQITKYINSSPFIFFSSLDKLKGIAKRVDEMGVDRKSKMFLYGIGVMGSLSRETWELKLKLFRELGFSEQNISDAFAAAPKVIGVSERKIREVTQLLLSVKDFSISDIVCNPILFTYSVEKRLKPRVRVLKALESKNLLKKKPSFNSFFQMTDAKFRNKYMIPYSNELGDIYLGSQGP